MSAGSVRREVRHGRHRLAAVMLVVTPVVLVPVGMASRYGSFETGLQARVVAVLQRSGYGLIDARVEGRDVRLSGPVGSERAAEVVRDLVHARRGVRRVESHFAIVRGAGDTVEKHNVAAPDWALLTAELGRPSQLPTVVIAITPGQIVVQGTASSAEGRRALMQRVEAVRGLSRLDVSRLRTTGGGDSSSSGTDGARRLGTFVATVAPTVESLEVSSDGQRLTLRGSVAAERRPALLGAAAFVTGDQSLVTDTLH